MTRASEVKKLRVYEVAKDLGMSSFDARPAMRAVRPPETPRTAVLRLLAEGPAKPKPV